MELQARDVSQDIARLRDDEAGGAVRRIPKASEGPLRTGDVTGHVKSVSAVYRPKSIEDVIALVRSARSARISGTPLYPISTGFNWGYGSRWVQSIIWIWGIVSAIALFPPLVEARDIDVTPSTLRAALSGLMPGDHLRLASGQYSHFTIANTVGTPSMPIVISGPEDGSAVIRADTRPCCNTIQINGDVSYLVIRHLTIDGLDVGGAFGIDARGPNVHHITIESCTFVHHDTSQSNVAISTKTPTAGWIIRGNRILGAGTGMYLGNSDGRHPFVEGLIENNLFYDTIGYNVQIKWQRPHDPVPGASGAASSTIIRHNVFIKTDRPSPDGNRPNLLVGGFPESGPNSEDVYRIYGNVFVHNPREALIQASGRVSIHDNLFIDTPQNAIRLTNHDLPLRRAWVYSNTFFVSGTAISLGASAPEGSLVVGNLIFAGRPTAGTITDLRDNITDTPANAAMYVTMPGTTLGSTDFFPRGSSAAGHPIDFSAFSGDVDHDLDFNCQAKGDGAFRGAYAGSGSNPGWTIAMENKPLDCAAQPRPDAGIERRDGGASSDAGVERRDGGAIERMDSGASGEPSDPTSTSTCACQLAGGSRSSGFAISSLMFAFLILLRTRAVSGARRRAFAVSKSFSADRR